MAKRIFSRLGYLLVSMLIMSLLIFILVELMPGDVATVMLGDAATPEAVAALRDSLGLNQPSHLRFLSWLGHILSGDLGQSMYMKGVDIAPLVGQKALNSAVLAVLATVIYVPLGLFCGAVSGLYEGRWPDHLLSTVGILGLALPTFVVGVLLMTLFSVTLGWLPMTSNIPIGKTVWQSLDRLILPALSVTFVMLGYLLRMVRASMITVMNSSYVRAAVLKGLPYWYVVCRHALGNALLPGVTVVGMNVGWMLGGLVVVETLFGFPGLGFLTVTAVTTRDVPLIEICVLVITLVYLVSNMLVDAAYVWLNPRLRHR